MIKKAVSDALLSLFMDKSAREKLRQVKTSPRPAPPREAPANARPPAPPPAAPASSPPRPPGGEDSRAHLEEKLTAAERALTSERRALIRSALKIQRDQAKKLHDIDAEDRDRLRAIALSYLAARNKRD